MRDFNAENSMWGYSRDSYKAKEVAEQADIHNAILMNDTAAYTRIGSSVQRNTNPDLTFGINIEEYCWTNSRENLGSDHFIMHVELMLEGYFRRAAPHQMCRNWDAFRSLREEEGRPLQDIEEWTASIVEDQRAVTREVENPTQARSMDERLRGMLEAYKSIYGRWQNTGKRYSKLHKRAAKL